MDLYIRHLGRQDYPKTLAAMHALTQARTPETPDEIWCLEHPPVFTQGQAGKPEHILHAGTIPIVQSDRGGQVTYHGPGQLIVYLLLDIKRLHYGVRDLVNLIEHALIDTLAQLGVHAYAQAQAPGVYVDTPQVQGAKIAALGLRIRKGCSLHGLSFNLDMDLSPFQQINPCGYAGMPVTQVKALCPGADMDWVRLQVITQLVNRLGHTQYEHTCDLPSTLN